MTPGMAATERTLVIERVLEAPRELVFQAWTEREHAERWWGPEGCEMTIFEMDVRPGGAWRRRLRTPDRGDFWRSGVYREVVAPERLVFTYVSDDPAGKQGHETLVTVTFEEHGDNATKLTLRQEGFESAAERDSHTGGWTTTIDRLAEYVAEG